MKKVFLLIFISALFMTNTHAQFSIGAKAGLTLANLSNLDLEHGTADIALGWNATVFAKIGKGLFSFQPEVMFIQKGTRINSKSDAAFAQLTMNYIDVPLLLRTTIGIKIVEIYINLGPYAGYWISGKDKLYFYDDSQSTWVTKKEDYDFDDNHDVRYDVGLVGGVGVKVLMIILEARYGHGFIDVFDSEHPAGNQNNSYFNISLGVQF